MKICPTCQSEYEDTSTACADDQTPLVDAAAWRAERQKAAERMAETTRFVQAAEAEDPFEAEAFTAAVDEANIPVLCRARKTGTVDVLMAAGSHAYWEILVPEDRLADAQQAIEARRAELDSEDGGAAPAAEDEEAAPEGHVVLTSFEDEEEAIQCVDRLTGSGISALLRGQTDVEADTVDGHDRPSEKVQVLVPSEFEAQAREVLAKPA